jgi:hypothetical protein
VCGAPLPLPPLPPCKERATRSVITTPAGCCWTGAGGSPARQGPKCARRRAGRGRAGLALDVAGGRWAWAQCGWVRRYPGPTTKSGGTTARRVCARRICAHKTWRKSGACYRSPRRDDAPWGGERGGGVCGRPRSTHIVFVRGWTRGGPSVRRHLPLHQACETMTWSTVDSLATRVDGKHKGCP